LTARNQNSALNRHTKDAGLIISRDKLLDRKRGTLGVCTRSHTQSVNSVASSFGMNASTNYLDSTGLAQSTNEMTFRIIPDPRNRSTYRIIDCS
jgi:hypothetical protein